LFCELAYAFENHLTATPQPSTIDSAGVKYLENSSLSVAILATTCLQTGIIGIQ